MINLILNKNIARRFTNFLNSEKGGKRIPYGLGSKLIASFCNSSYAREIHFKNKLILLDEFLANMQDPPGIEDLLPLILVSNFSRTWRSMALSYLSKKKLKSYCTFNGLDKFDDCYRQGKGVILVNSHFGFAESALSIFPNLGYRNFSTIVRAKGTTSLKIKGLNPKVTPNLLVFRDHTNVELFKQLFKARDILKSGGIFHILGDGYHGKSSITINFLGRARGFRASFTELGLSTEAFIFTIFITSDVKGYLTVDLIGPLDKGDETMDHQARVEHMTRQYATLLEERWKKEPQHINWGFMDKYLRQIKLNLE